MLHDHSSVSLEFYEDCHLFIPGSKPCERDQSVALFWILITSTRLLSDLRNVAIPSSSNFKAFHILVYEHHSILLPQDSSGFVSSKMTEAGHVLALNGTH